MRVSAQGPDSEEVSGGLDFARVTVLQGATNTLETHGEEGISRPAASCPCLASSSLPNEFMMLTLLRNASIYAPEFIGESDVLLADGRVAAMAPGLPDLPAELPHEIHDLSGHLLIPGLIDAHVHLSGGGGAWLESLSLRQGRRMPRGPRAPPTASDACSVLAPMWCVPYTP